MEDKPKGKPKNDVLTPQDYIDLLKSRNTLFAVIAIVIMLGFYIVPKVVVVDPEAPHSEIREEPEQVDTYEEDNSPFPLAFAFIEIFAPLTGIMIGIPLVTFLAKSFMEAFK